MRQVAEEHRPFLSALLARDAEGATRALEAHLVRTKELVIDALSDGARRGSTPAGARPER